MAVTLEQHADVLGGAASQRRQRVAAFERRYDAPLRMARGDRHQLARDPRVVGLGELETGQRILAMRVEAGRDENELRPVRLERRQPAVDDRRAEGIAAVAGRKRNVDHVRRLVLDAAVRVQRILERGDHQHARVALEDVFGAVAVMHVEVDDGDALQSMRGQRVRGADGDVVEDAESHRAPPLRMMAGRAHRAERGPAFAAHHEVDPMHDGAGRVARSGQRMRIERGIGIDEMQARLGTCRDDLVDVGRAMHARDLLVRRRGRRIVLDVGIEAGGDQAVADRASGVPGTRDGRVPFRATGTTGG